MHRQGYALIAAIIFSVLVLFTAAAFLLLTSGRYRLVRESIKRNEAYFTAEAGLWYVKSELRTNPRNFSDVIDIGGRNLTINVADGRKTGERKIQLTVPY